MSSRLFEDLREKENITYHVASYVHNIADVGFIDLDIGVSTDPNLTSEADPNHYYTAINGFNRNVERLKTETISEEDFATLLKNAESIGLITDDDYGSIQFADCCGYHFAAIFYKKE